ncbi:conserved oligomeric Golgi complex subunit 6 [Geosmithia morbida]|uniref:Conserved oligomeric Golgi complex subunit 6 n=1 Tax=Geosmithia morbida TaxID=1094350 RepID=A0A9P4YV61_9HYPO|nr:conserved oligomeric Golgi complex subunit 6 [Geosmithia morbida]KAF4121574.1 conserved oligomeric Golgi complex subunit 6 [Geosmithia morbida]
MSSETPSTLRNLPPRSSAAGGFSSPLETSSSTAKGASPLASKVTSVLSTSYSDTEFRDALSLLDQRGVSNTAETRRRIRMDLQKEVIDSNGEIISEFGRVAEQLHKIKATVDKLNASYNDMRKQIVSAHSDTEPALVEANSLLGQRKQIETKQELLEAFTHHFTMSDDELAALTMTAEPVDNCYFDALAKAKKINKDCEVLLGFEKQTLGLELMEQTSKSINLGFQKLYKWVQREFKTLNLENPHMNASMRRALRVLAERPSLFQNCLDLFAESRERIMSDSFYTALTGESSSGVEDPSTKPIDLTAHDPLRYVGDMLAWIHSATVSEREALESLFVSDGDELAKGLRSGRDAELWRLVAEDDEKDGGPAEFNPLEALNNLVDRDILGASRVLRQRVEQVIQSNEEIVPAYKLANLLEFYLVTFQKLLGPDSNLLESMKALQAEAMRQFRALVREHIATLQAEFQQTPSDLGPPSFLQESLKQLDAYMQTYDLSLANVEEREAGFESILAEAFDPFIAGCENMASAMKTPDATIFLINCRLMASVSLGKFDFTQSRLREQQAKTDAGTKELVEIQHQYFRNMSGLDSILEAVSEGKDTAKDTLQISRLSEASQRLDDFLPSAWMDAMETLRHLQDSGLAHRITEEAAELFCADFEKLEDAIIEADGDSTDDEETLGELRSAFQRTTAEIRVLLS